jgi:alpha/beta superfamily hydrolase
MDHVVAAEIAWAAAMSGHATLRFNYRGVGASQGKVSENSHLADALAALEVLEETYPDRMPAVLSIGVSAQVLTEMAKQREVAGMAAVSPAEVEVETLARWGPRSLVIVAEHDLRMPRATLAQAVAGEGGQLEVVAGADRHFSKNLAQIGKRVASWLDQLESEKSDDISTT